MENNSRKQTQHLKASGVSNGHEANEGRGGLNRKATGRSKNETTFLPFGNPNLNESHGSTPFQEEVKYFLNRVMRFRCPELRSDDDPDDLDLIWDPFWESPPVPVFGDMKDYAIREKKQKELWAVEAERLCGMRVRFMKPTMATHGKSLEKLEAPPLIDEKSLMKRAINNSSLEDLQDLADNLLYSLHICVLDDEGLLGTFSDRGHDSFKILSRVVNRLNIPERKEKRPPENATSKGPAPKAIPETTKQGPTTAAPSTSTGPSTGSSTGQPARQGTDIPVPQKSYDEKVARLISRKPPIMEIQPASLTEAEKLKLRPYYNLIDQITATIAHLSFSVWEKDCMCGENDYWDMILIACLATISAKMKILAFNLRENIEGCLKRNKTFESPESKHNDGPSSEASEVPLDDNSQDEDRYIKEFTGVTSWLVKCFTSVLTGLGAQKSWKIPSNDVDVAAVVYPAGVKGTSTLLFQDRRRSMSGTADTLPMHFCMTALKLVKDLDNKLPQETEPPTLSSTPREDAAGSGDKTEETNCFFYMEGHVNRYNLVGDLHLHGKPHREYSKIWQYVIITIALSISQPDIGEAFQDTLRPISALSAFGIPNLLPDDPFYAFLGLRLTPKSPSAPSKTSQFRSTETPFSSLAKQKREILNHIILDPSIRVDFKTPLGILFDRGQNKRKFLQDRHREWTVGQDSIKIQYRRWVVISGSISIALVLGGFACTFLIGEGVAGVDPFNFTMFFWAFAGFTLVMTKSMKVSDWTWWDFLRLQVSCRTVTELASATCLSVQDILLILLSSEPYSQLKTNGPFKSSFSLASEEGGFLIDAEPSLETLLAAGIVPVVVRRLNGPAILLLRLVPGGNGLRSVDKAGTVSGQCHCIHPPQRLRDGNEEKGEGGNGKAKNDGGESEHKDEGENKVILINGDVRWIDIVGLFNWKGAKFR